MSFCAYLSNNQTNGNGMTVNLDTKEFDYGNNFNLATHAFVAPVKGVYLFQGNVSTISGTSVLSAIARTSSLGNNTKRGAWVYGNGYVASSCSCSFQLNAGDSVKLVALQIGGGTPTIASSSVSDFATWLSGELLYVLP